MTSRILVLATAVLAVATGCSVLSGADAADNKAVPQTTETAESEPGSTTATTAAVATDPIDGEPTIEPVDWEDCGSGLSCGTVTVPLDYDDPAGPTLDIALVRRPATGDPVGSIFVNPGGPGASGIEFVRNGFRFDSKTEQRYDLIGFDPRGIGQSSPLTCTVDRADAPLADMSPDTTEELARLDREAAEIVAACTGSDGTVLPHLTTLNVARDLDRLRQAVGDDELHYYGLSYGTLLAIRYGQLFPDNVGHLALDGVVDPTADLTDLLRQQAVAFETQFARLDDRCTDARCPPDGIAATFDRVHERLESDGPVDGVGTVELVIASLLPAYSPTSFEVYAGSLQEADGGNFTGIETLSDFFVSSISFTAYAAFACADGEPPSGAESWEAFAAELQDLAPRFGAVVANELRVCAFWPPADPEPAGDPSTAPNGGGVSAESLAGLDVPILVIGNTGDAATPLENAELVASLLPDAALVVLESDRHTAYHGSSCVQGLVSDYFADVPVPARTTCEPG